MKIFPYKGIIYSHSQNYASIMSNEDKTIIINDGNINLDELKVNFGLNDIISKDKVFVSSESSFPSLFLSRIEGIDISRTVNLDKATKIIVDKIKRVVIDESKMWYFELEPNDANFSKLRCVSPDINRCSAQSLIASFDNRLDSSIYTMTFCEPCIVINYNFDLSKLILNYPEKLVLTKKLIDYTNKFLPSLDNDTLESLSSMLAGDKETVRLAVNMLSNFNLSTHIIPIAGMIRRNYDNIVKSKCGSLSAFNRICDVCGVNKYDLQSSSILEFNSKLYSSVNSDNDRMLLKNLVRDYISDEVKAQYQKYLSQMGLELCID